MPEYGVDGDWMIYDDLGTAKRIESRPPPLMLNFWSRHSLHERALPPKPYRVIQVGGCGPDLCGWSGLCASCGQIGGLPAQWVTFSISGSILHSRTCTTSLNLGRP